MKLHKGVWFPDKEIHMIDWCDKNGEMVDGKTTYQYKKLSESLKWVKQFRTAIDVGAHCGTWSAHLVTKFKELHAFEPVAEFRECFEKNTHGAQLYSCALGSVSGRVRMSINEQDTGGTHVDTTAEDGNVDLMRLDDFNFQDVDYIKIDAEGYEAQIIEGALETLKQWKPCVVVEQKQHIAMKNYGTKGTPAVDKLVSLGAKVRKVMGGDYIMSFE